MTAGAAGTEATLAELAAPRERTRVRALWKLVRSQPLGTISLLVLAAYVVIAVCAPLIATHDPYALDATATYVRPNGEFLFGTDNFGRDVFSRVVYGTRITVTVGFTTVLLAALL